MSTHLFSKTPSVAILSNLGLTVRDISYCRHPDTPDVMDERITRHYYDPRGFLARSADPRLYNNGQVNFTYLTDLVGNVLRTCSADAGTTVALNDAGGRPFKAISNIGEAAEDKEDRSQSVTRTFHYENADLPGRLLMVEEQVAGVEAHIIERYIYAGNTIEEQSLNLCGKCVSFYDTAGLLQTDSVALNGVPLCVTRRFVQAADNPDTVVDWRGQDVSAWNDLLAAEAFISTTYTDSTGVVLRTTDAKGNEQRVAYDIAGLLAGSWLTVKGSAEQVIIKSLSYSAAGLKLSEEHGNGVIISYTYDGQTQRLIAVKTERPSGHLSGAKILQDLRYEYDPVGNVLNIRNDAEETRFWRNQKIVPENTYTYDSLYQLVSATGREMANAGQQQNNAPPATVPLPVDNAAYTGYIRNYRYDNAGNLIQIRHSAPATNNSYTTDITISNRSNRGVLSSLTVNPADVDPLFTPGGLQRQLQPGQMLNWTPRNTLHNVTPVIRDGDVDDRESYCYDGSGLRVLKINVQKMGNTTQTGKVVYLPGLELRTLNNDTTEIENLHVISVHNGQAQVRLLHWESGKPDVINNDQLRWTYNSYMGGSQLELDVNGNIISMEEFYPYGGTAVITARSSVEVSYKTIRYSGNERDATGLYYYSYRYYQPWAGRWLSADPAETSDGLNLYRMVHNNPLSFFDPDGKAPVSLIYGFEPFRQEYIRQQPGQQRAMVRIDELNSSLDLQERLQTDFSGTVNAIRRFSSNLNTSQRNYYLAEAADLQKRTGLENVEQAFSLIIDWRSFLAKHANELTFSALVKKDKMTNSMKSDPEGGAATTMLYGFLNKNLPGKLLSRKIEHQSVVKLSMLINEDAPDTKIAQAMKEDANIRVATMNAFFRKTSKLGLAWASQREDIDITFIEGAFNETVVNDPHLSSEKNNWRELGKTDIQQMSAKSYKVKKRVVSYLPITYSEMKYVRKHNIGVNSVSIATLR
ncbi:RHS repeat protein [Kosakonia pseudosacchari]|uniref:Insecticidal toxin complex protein TccC n=1 Tax=Kosakonia pseudosacchari TaxID=1646340 RepID=A0ABX4IQ52_9ENTR|nr:RHS repeat domain-containing protein [Kosakonia pseudosacchari]PDO85668.1 hypothetical protein BK796_14280 [Kosakonia pseudosacchari]